MGLTTNLNCCRIFFHEQYHFGWLKIQQMIFWGDSTLWSEKNSTCSFLFWRRPLFRKDKFLKNLSIFGTRFFWAVDILGKVMARWTLDFHDCQIFRCHEVSKMVCPKSMKKPSAPQWVNSFHVVQILKALLLNMWWLVWLGPIDFSTFGAGKWKQNIEATCKVE